MAYNLESLSIDECFMTQQAFRDFFVLESVDSVHKIQSTELLKIAEIIKAIVKNELVSCGNHANSMIALNIGYQVLGDDKQEAEEKYSVKWEKSPSFTENIEISEQQVEAQSDESSPLTIAFTHKLTERLDELSAASENTRITSFNMKFSPNRISGCIIDRDEFEGVFYKRWFCNEQPSSWVLNSFGQKVKWMERDNLNPQD